jgi:hypothetical protein
MIIKESINIETKIRDERLAAIRKNMADIHGKISETQQNQLDKKVGESIKGELKARGLSPQELIHFELIFDDNLEGNAKTMNKLSSTCKIL